MSISRRSTIHRRSQRKALPGQPQTGHTTQNLPRQQLRTINARRPYTRARSHRVTTPEHAARGVAADRPESRRVAPIVQVANTHIEAYRPGYPKRRWALLTLATHEYHWVAKPPSAAGRDERQISLVKGTEAAIPSQTARLPGF